MSRQAKITSVLMAYHSPHDVNKKSLQLENGKLGRKLVFIPAEFGRTYSNFQMAGSLWQFNFSTSHG